MNSWWSISGALDILQILQHLQLRITCRPHATYCIERENFILVEVRFRGAWPQCTVLVAGEASTHEELFHGFAECMQDSLFEQSPFVAESDGPDHASSGGAAIPNSADRGTAAPDDSGGRGGGGGGGVDRAMLVLQLLLGAQQGPAPNFTHLLFGFNVQNGPEGALSHLYLKMEA